GFCEELVVEPGALLAEDERITREVARVEVARRRDGAEEEQARARSCVTEVLEVEVLLEIDEVPVVDARAPHRVLVDPKAEAADEVELALGRGRDARD